MAELAVLVAVKKIGNAVAADVLQRMSSILSKEMELIAQLPVSMKRIRREFVVMQAFLSSIDSKSYDNSMEAWLQELRKIANEVEDVVDRFVFLSGDDDSWSGCGPFKIYTGRPRDGWGGCGLFQILTRKPQSLPEWHQIALKLKDLQEDLQHASQINERWLKLDNIRESLPSTASLQPTDAPDIVNERELVGIEENREKLESMILSEEDSWWQWLWSKNRLSAANQSETTPTQIIAVWGQSGVGKTTLVSYVYERVKSKFDLHAYIRVSSIAKPEELLGWLIKKFKKSYVNQKDSDTMSQSKLLRSILAKKKFIIVLDDVRSTFDTQIKSVLVSEVEGSRVIITTESKDLADLVNAQFELEVKRLDRKQAKSLLLKKAFPKDKNTDFPADLDMSATKIIEHCDGLPAAVASAGVLLSQRKTVKSEWDKVADQFMRHVEHNDTFSHPKIAFELSLKYLPKYLKNCYSFCSIFPKGFIFKRKELIRIWIAEGFVEQRDNTSMEEVAEQYLDELVKFCMFEVVEKSVHGKLKRFKMQAFKQEILMLISKREHFSMVCSDPKSLNHASGARHLCLHMWSKSYISKLDIPRLRSFMVKGGDISEHFLHSVMSTPRFLMVLDLHKTGINSIPDSIGDLFNLHYINVRRTKVSKLPRTIGKLKNLQTLDVTDTEITELPSEITLLKKLRHLFVGKESDISPVVPAPGRFRHTKDLQTLHGIGASDDFAKDLEELTGLRNLSIPNVKQTLVNKLISALEKSSTLLKLEIIAKHGKRHQLSLPGIEALKSVRKLKLQGRLVEATLMHSLSYIGENLTSLCLSSTGFKDMNFIKHLGKLQSLETLKLRNVSNCDRLHFTAEAFLNLKKLFLLDMESVQKIIFDESGMQSLKFVSLRNLPNLKEYPKNLEILKLHELRLRALHPSLDEEEARVLFSKFPKFSFSSPD